MKHFSDITRLYISKYGVPLANTRIFIRAWQQVEGCECRGQMRLTKALVPTSGPPEQAGKRAKNKSRTRGRQERNKRRMREQSPCNTPAKRLHPAYNSLPSRSSSQSLRSRSQSAPLSSPQGNPGGGAINFLAQVLRLSSNDPMGQITGWVAP